MDKMNYPRGLVRYTSQHAMEGATAHVVRPRMIVYGVLLAALVVGFFVSISLRTPVGLDVMRDRNALYRALPDGSIENVYLLRILNKDTRSHVYVLGASGLPGISLEAGETAGTGERGRHEVGPGEVYSLPVRVRVPRGEATGSHEILFEVAAEDVPSLKASREARFLGP
jgi:polyferredoxin